MRAIYVIVLLCIFFGCKRPYLPPASKESGSYLVVEGVINAGADSTFITLSRTVPLNSNTFVRETHAVINVESDQHTLYQLLETRPGVYTAGPLNLDGTRKYRLNIATTDQQQYQSDFVAVDITPPIDSVGYTVDNNGLKVYLNTHDATNNTKYYRWDYTETWQFFSKYNSEYYVTRDTLLPRPDSLQIHYCFASDTASTILLGSTADLKAAVVNQAPITQVSATSEKLEAKYSIQVKQYALTGDAYSFWTNLKKNTEQLGSIFDAEPSQINGNIHCISDVTKPVVGYVSVANVQTKRIFITNSNLPGYFFAIYPYTCEEDSTLLYNPVTKNNDVEGLIIGAVPGTVLAAGPLIKNNGIIGYFRTTPICADCTLRGTVKQPASWK